MPVLNWGEQPLNLEVSQRSVKEVRLTLRLSRAHLDELVTELSEIFAANDGSFAPELRLVLPQNWVLFWKARSEGARLLLAHPATDEWVGTVALEISWAGRMMESFSRLESGQRVLLSQLGGIHSVSNFDLEFFLI
jgi:hypothetical protein